MDLPKKQNAIEVVQDTPMERNIAQLDAVPTENEKDTDLERLYAPALSPEQQRRLWRKVDMRILPVLSALYLCCYLDRGTLHPILKQHIVTSER